MNDITVCDSAELHWTHEQGGGLQYRILIQGPPPWALLLQEANSLLNLPGFNASASPSILDRRCSAVYEPPGKAVATCYPQTRVNLEPGCNDWHEVVSEPSSHCGNTSVLLRAPWELSCIDKVGFSISSARTVLVGADFSAPHPTWRYN